MRTYKLTSSLVPFCLLLGGCGLFSIDPDEIDVADDEVGEADDLGDDTEVGQEETADTGDGDGDGEGTGSEGSSTTDDTGVDESDTTEVDTSDATSDTGDTDIGTDSDTGTDTGPNGCESLPEDTACLACVKVECCDELSACLADSVCACNYECLGEGQSESECAMMCGPLGDELTDLAGCSATYCSEQCF